MTEKRQLEAKREILLALKNAQDSLQELNLEISRVKKTVTTLKDELEDKQLTFEFTQDNDSKTRL